MSDPLLSLWGGAVTVIGLPDAASCDPESCSCPCLLCLGGMVLGGVYRVLWHRGLDPFPGRWLLWLASAFVSAASPY